MSCHWLTTSNGTVLIGNWNIVSNDDSATSGRWHSSTKQNYIFKTFKCEEQRFWQRWLRWKIFKYCLQSPPKRIGIGAKDLFKWTYLINHHKYLASALLPISNVNLFFYQTSTTVNVCQPMSLFGNNKRSFICRCGCCGNCLAKAFRDNHTTFFKVGLIS